MSGGSQHSRREEASLDRSRHNAWAAASGSHEPAKPNSGPDFLDLMIGRQHFLQGAHAPATNAPAVRPAATVSPSEFYFDPSPQPSPSKNLTTEGGTAASTLAAYRSPPPPRVASLPGSGGEGRLFSSPSSLSVLFSRGQVRWLSVAQKADEASAQGHAHAMEDDSSLPCYNCRFVASSMDDMELHLLSLPPGSQLAHREQMCLHFGLPSAEVASWAGVRVGASGGGGKGAMDTRGGEEEEDAAGGGGGGEEAEEEKEEEEEEEEEDLHAQQLLSAQGFAALLAEAYKDLPPPPPRKPPKDRAPLSFLEAVNAAGPAVPVVGQAPSLDLPQDDLLGRFATAAEEALFLTALLRDVGGFDVKRPQATAGDTLVQFATAQGYFKSAASTRMWRYGDVFTIHFTALLFVAASTVVGALWQGLPVATTNDLADKKKVRALGVAGREQAAFLLCKHLLKACTRDSKVRHKIGAIVHNTTAADFSTFCRLMQGLHSNGLRIHEYAYVLALGDAFDDGELTTDARFLEARRSGTDLSANFLSAITRPASKKGPNPLCALLPLAEAMVWAPAAVALAAWASDSEAVVDLSGALPVGLFVGNPPLPTAEVLFATAIFFMQWLNKWALMEDAVQPALSGAAVPGFPKLLEHVKGWHACITPKVLKKHFGIIVGSEAPTMGEYGICAVAPGCVDGLRAKMSSPVLNSSQGRKKARTA